jgi:hypothetical protein
MHVMQGLCVTNVNKASSSFRYGHFWLLLRSAVSGVGVQHKRWIPAHHDTGTCLKIHGVPKPFQPAESLNNQQLQNQNPFSNHYQPCWRFLIKCNQLFMKSRSLCCQELHCTNEMNHEKHAITCSSPYRHKSWSWQVHHHLLGVQQLPRTLEWCAPDQVTADEGLGS